MPSTGRNRKAVINITPDIRLQEKGYPGNRFYPIHNKWVYVLGDNRELIDELFLTKTRWVRMRRAFQGKRLEATPKTSTRLSHVGRYSPLRTKNRTLVGTHRCLFGCCVVF